MNSENFIALYFALKQRKPLGLFPLLANQLAGSRYGLLSGTGGAALKAYIVLVANGF